MATNYVTFDQLDDENKKNGVSLGGGQSAMMQAGGPTGTTNTAPAPSKSGTFTNLSKYVSANAGNDAQMGQGVYGAVQNKTESANKAATDWQSGADSEIKKNTVTDSNGVAGKLASDPMSVTDQEYNDTQRGYSGPKNAQDIAGYGNVVGGFNQAQDYANLASGQSAANRSTVLSDVYGSGNNYSRGMSSLDSHILGAGAGGKAALKNISEKFGNYGTNAKQGLDSAVGSSITNAVNTSDQTAKSVKTAAENAFAANNAKIQGVQDKVNAENQGNNQEYNTLVQNLNSTDPSARNDAYAKLGISPDVAEYYKNTMGGNIGSVLSKGADVGLGDVVDSGTQDSYQRLAKLLGKNPTYNFAKGSAGGPAYNVDQNAVQGIVSGVGTHKSANQKPEQAAPEPQKSSSSTPASIAGTPISQKSLGPVVKPIIDSTMAGHQFGIDSTDKLFPGISPAAKKLKFK